MTKLAIVLAFCCACTTTATAQRKEPKPPPNVVELHVVMHPSAYLEALKQQQAANQDSQP